MTGPRRGALAVAAGTLFAVALGQLSWYLAGRGMPMESDSSSLSRKRAGSLPQELPSPVGPGPTSDPRLARLREHWPLRDRVRDEVARNPHLPSALVLEFSREIGRLLEVVRGDPGLARSLVAELGACVQADSLVDAARAVCLAQARRVPSLHPEAGDLGAAAERVRDRAPPRIRSIVDALEHVESSPAQVTRSSDD